MILRVQHVYLGVGMKIKHHVIALFAAMVAASACAQSVPLPLNLNLPPNSVPTASVAPAQNKNSVAAAPVTTDASKPSTNPAQMQPGVQYDDAEGMPEYSDASAAQKKCDDKTYNEPQVHGDMTVGVVAGNHVSGNYQSGVVNVSKALGSCDNPAGGVSISVGVGQGNFNGRRQRWH